MADLVIAPMPDELAIAHQERIRRFLCIDSKVKFERWLKQRFSKESSNAATSSRLAQLAAVGSMSSVDYAHRHSMLGVLRFVAKAANLGLHGSADGENFSNRMGMLVQKPQASFCPRCAEIDLREDGFSWFRRSHQLEGLDWCPHHWVRLQQVHSSQAWDYCPHEWINKNEYQAADDFGQAARPDNFDICFARIAIHALNQKGPIEHQDISVAIGKRARELNLRVSKRGVRSSIGDKVNEIAPHSWLIKRSSNSGQRGHGAILRALDRLATGAAPPSGLTYVTALACLWPSNPDGAISCLRQLEVSEKPLTRQKRQTQLLRPPDYWFGHLWPTYVASKGCVSKMANALDQDRRVLILKMRQAGLPHLRSVNSPQWQAFIRFSDGEPLHEACEAEGADPALVQALLRECSVRVSTVAKQLSSKSDLKVISELPIQTSTANSIKRLQLVEPANESWPPINRGKKLPPS